VQVEAQLTAGANPNWYNNQAGGATALHAAARGEGQEASKIVAILLKGGAVPDVLTLPEFNTPLHLAACKGNLESVKHLLDVSGARCRRGA
jgi:ankyrin repeat protein